MEVIISGLNFDGYFWPATENHKYLRRGWWPIYPATDKPENASTHAAALSILVLNEQTRMGLIKQEDQEKVDSATLAGSTWLYKNSIPGKSLWTDYPLIKSGRESQSISGLVIHVLHQVNSPALNETDRLWLQNLPDGIPSAVRFESSNQEVYEESGKWKGDDTRYYPLQWMIIATVDAYGNGTTLERVKALRWLERVVATLKKPPSCCLRSALFTVSALSAVAQVKHNTSPEMARMDTGLPHESRRTFTDSQAPASVSSNFLGLRLVDPKRTKFLEARVPRR